MERIIWQTTLELGRKKNEKSIVGRIKRHICTAMHRLTMF